jgi:uncharacterized protein
MNILSTVSSLIRYCAALTVLSAATALATDVVDDGNFFKPDTIRIASGKIQELNRLHGYRIKVETIAALPAGESDEVRQMSASERARFFGHFLSKRAAAEKLDLLIFASRDPKYLQVLPHKELETAGFTPAMRDKLASALIAGFHSQKYDESLLSAMDQLEQDLTGVHRAALKSPSHPHAQMAFPGERVPVQQPAETSWFGPVALIALLVGGFLLIRRLLSGSNRAAIPGGGGGFMGNILGGVFGAVAGNWLYDSFFRSTAHGQDLDQSRSEGGWFGSSPDSSSDGSDYTADSYDAAGGGGDFGGSDMGGDDSGGGGDF